MTFPGTPSDDPLRDEIRASYAAGASINEVARQLMIGHARIREHVADIRRPKQHHPIEQTEADDVRR